LPSQSTMNSKEKKNTKGRRGAKDKRGDDTGEGKTIQPKYVILQC